MARPLKPLVRGGGYYPSKKWTPLVYNGGYTTMDGGEEPVPPPPPINWKTITGVSPITLVNALAHSIHSLTQYGKCVQGGTPTPSAPVDIVCNNGAIKYGWYDIITTSSLSGYGTYVSPSGTAGNRAYKWYKDLPNGTYTFSVDGDYELIVQWRDPADPSNIVPSAYENLSGWMTSGEVVLDKEGGGYGIAVKRTSGTSSITPSNFDGVLHVAEQRLYTDGTPEVLTVIQNQNTDPTIVKATLASGTTEVYYDTNSRCIVAPVKPNTVYSIGFLTKPTGGSIFRVATTKELVSYSAQSTASIAYDLDMNNYATKTLNSGNEASWMYVQLSNTMSEETFASIVIQEGTSLTPPQTVTDLPMLLSVGDTKDEAEIISGGQVHNVGIKVLTSADVRSFSNGCWFVDVSGKKKEKSLCLCTHYVYDSGSSSGISDGQFGCASTTRNFYFKNSNISDIDEAKTFVDDQSAAGTPIIALYPLEEETTEQTTPHALNSYEGATVVDAQTNVDPVTLSVEYASSEE